jgi:hypothetical protein
MTSNCSYCNKIFIENENDYNKLQHLEACKKKPVNNNKSLLKYFETRSRSSSSSSAHSSAPSSPLARLNINRTNSPSNNNDNNQVINLSNSSSEDETISVDIPSSAKKRTRREIHFEKKV